MSRTLIDKIEAAAQRSGKTIPFILRQAEVPEALYRRWKNGSNAQDKTWDRVMRVLSSLTLPDAIDQKGLEQIGFTQTEKPSTRTAEIVRLIEQKQATVKTINLEIEALELLLQSA